MKLFSRKVPKKIKKIIPKKTLIDKLIFSPEVFSFSKAIDVALLSQGVDLQNLSYSSVKTIELKSAINFASKYSDIKYVEGIKDGLVEISINPDGIAGIEGQLPDLYVEDYILFNRESKQGVIDFLDIFNSRFLATKYLFLKKYDVASLSVPIEKSVIGNILFSLAGFDSNEDSGLNESNVPQQLKISCQNFFWRRSRSAEGLRVILSSFCDAPVVVKQFSGKFVAVDKSQQTAIGSKMGKYNELGIYSFLGNKVWDQCDGVDIFIGPLDFDNYIKYLPKKNSLDQKMSALEKVKSIIKEFVPFGFSVNLHFKLDECFVKELYLNGIKQLNKDAFIFGKHSLKTTEFIERI